MSTELQKMPELLFSVCGVELQGWVEALPVRGSDTPARTGTWLHYTSPRTGEDRTWGRTRIRISASEKCEDAGLETQDRLALKAQGSWIHSGQGLPWVQGGEIRPWATGSLCSQ